jgi:hypothetical protein
MQNKTNKNKPTSEMIQINRLCTFDDNSVLLDFDRLNISYLKVINPELVEQCAKDNDWLTKLDSEGEDYKVTLDGFMVSDFSHKEAVQLAEYYLAKVLPQDLIEREIAITGNNGISN